MTLIHRLLRQHISIGQLTGFFFANLVGAVIILAGVQLSTDLKPLFEENEGMLGNEYIVISKPVNAPQFSDEEIEDLMSQDFTVDAGSFIASQFNVYAHVRLAGNSVGTYMFFEAVPDKFIDFDMEKWRYNEEERIIPIIIPRNYLNLYNLGFAKSQGLPQIPEETITSIPINITLGGRFEREEYKAYIVGFTNRINSILVPYDFLEHANATFAPNRHIQKSRLIIEVDNPTDEAINTYFTRHGYEVEGNDADNSKGNFLIRIFLSVLFIIGGIICLLSVYILTLSINLLLHKNTAKLANLLALGYTPGKVAGPYMRLTAILNTAIAVLAVIIVAIFRNCYISMLSEAFTISGNSLVTVIISAGALSAAIIGFNCIIIRRYVNNIAALKKNQIQDN